MVELTNENNSLVRRTATMVVVERMPRTTDDDATMDDGRGGMED